MHQNLHLLVLLNTIGCLVFSLLDLTAREPKTSGCQSSANAEIFLLELVS
jgi:hypothetical protein